MKFFTHKRSTPPASPNCPFDIAGLEENVLASVARPEAEVCEWNEAEIAVTPEMIEAGRNILVDNDYLSDPTACEAFIVEQIQLVALKLFAADVRTSPNQSEAR